MSGIFGLVHFDGSPIAGEELNSMRAAMAHWGPDGVRCWSHASAGLGQCLYLDTPEAVYETLPSFASECGVAFTAQARLDNRDELCDALSVHHSDRPTMADGELVRRAYMRWGPECPARLLGDWSLVAWSPRERQLFLARDHHGVTSLYYFADRRRLAFASDRRALLALSGVSTELNELYLAQQLVAWPAFFGAETAYRALRRLPPAHAMQVTPNDTRVWRYWRLEEAPEVRLATPGDYAEGLREHLRQAVRARLRTTKSIAVALSGGLDSGAVAVLAARELGATGRTLTALTAVPTHIVNVPGFEANEFTRAAVTARAAGNVSHLAVSRDDFGPVDGVERQLEIHGEPGIAVGNYYWFVPVVEAARGGILLTGQGGNGSISWPGVPCLADAALALKEGRFAQAARAAARVGLFGRAVGECRRLRVLAAEPRGQPWRSYSAIHPRFAERMRLRELMAAAGYDPTMRRLPGSIRDARFDELHPGCDAVGAIWAELGAAAQVAARDPTLDARLLSFAVGIPNRHWRGPLDRWLIREAMRGRLPDEVRLATRRGRQASDIVPRLAGQASHVTAVLSEIGASDDARRYVDVEYLRRVHGLLGSASPREAFWMAVTVLIRGLVTGLFVARSASSTSNVR